MAGASVWHDRQGTALRRDASPRAPPPPPGPPGPSPPAAAAFPMDAPASPGRSRRRRRPPPRAQRQPGEPVTRAAPAPARRGTPGGGGGGGDGGDNDSGSGPRGGSPHGARQPGTAEARESARAGAAGVGAVTCGRAPPRPPWSVGEGWNGSLSPRPPPAAPAPAPAWGESAPASAGVRWHVRKPRPPSCLGLLLVERACRGARGGTALPASAEGHVQTLAEPARTQLPLLGERKELRALAAREPPLGGRPRRGSYGLALSHAA
ncbi:basic proline-rich protein-like [Dromiciops gliroides]|uniref:basic proline-rich protein-like n=1 Tax=Dromiciops gliroides TaxID=33562 RepID=UPI001CC46029|nr:basic proline-rich protein-like [Dromiciops gliroides]